MRRVVIGIGAIVAVGLVGYGFIGGYRSKGSGASQEVVRVQMDVAKVFSSWGALKGASTRIVVGTAGTQRYSLVHIGSGPGSDPWTSTEVHVEMTLQGSAQETVLVRQLGGPTSDGAVETVDQFPVLQPGQRYLLFLTPSEPFPGEFYPVGAFQGVFPISQNGRVNPFSPAATSIGVPVRDMPLTDVVNAIHGARALNVTP